MRVLSESGDPHVCVGMRRSTFVKTRPEFETLSEIPRSAEAIDELRWHTEAIAREIARHELACSGRRDVGLEELTDVGMTFFDRALTKYVEHRERRGGKARYKFTTYFTWWITAGIRTYLGTAARPIRGITPKED